jgi:YggT family protein
LAFLVCRLLEIYLIVMIGRVIISWFPISPGSALSSIYSFLYAVTEPVLAPIRRVMPPLGMGGMGLDLSPIILFLGISVLSRIICT